MVVMEEKTVLDFYAYNMVGKLIFAMLLWTPSQQF